MQAQDQSQAVVSVPRPRTNDPSIDATVTPTITVVGADGKNQTLAIPGTEGDMRALMARRQELSDQLTSVSDRRHNLSMELQGTADAGARAGLLERISVLDKRILQLENDIAVSGSQLAAAPSDLIGITEAARDEPQGDEFPEGVMVGGSSVLFASVIFFLFARRLRRRRSRGAPPPLENESALRLQRLEQGMEAIAIEIERVSEGQRFVTKLLSEQQPVGAPRRVAPAQAIGEDR
jgi:hypothetical protein